MRLITFKTHEADKYLTHSDLTDRNLFPVLENVWIESFLRCKIEEELLSILYVSPIAFGIVRLL